MKKTLDDAFDEPKDDKKPKKKSGPTPDQIRLEQIRKSLGVSDDTVRLADQHIAIKNVISTGLPDLDRILTPMLWESSGIGGIPRGFVAEFFGPYSGGKSSLGMKLSATVTKGGGYVLWFDAEGSYVPEWAARHGVDNGKVIIVDAGRSGEFYLEQIESAATKGQVDLIVIDSVTAMTPKEVLETNLEKEARVGAAAKMMARAMPRIQTAAKKGNVAIVFINQIRQKVGVMYGNPETTPGGESLKFYASLRLRLSQVGSRKERGIMKGDEEVGIRTNVQVVKSRFGPPYKETIMPIYFSDAKPHPLDTIIDAALSVKAVASRSKRLDNGEIVQTFKFGDIKVEGIEEFKGQLNKNSIKELARLAIEGKVLFDGEVQQYLKSLDDDPTETSNDEAIGPDKAN